MYQKLFIPGPTDVDPLVLEKMATPMIGHRTKEATVLQQSVSEKLQKLMYTQDTILLSTSSGTGLMEGAIRSCTRKRAAVFSVGAFGNRWYELAKYNQVPADIFKSEPGQPTTPEMVEEVLKTGLYDVVTVTHNETSSGIVNPCQAIGQVIRSYPDVLYLVDTVSSLGGAKVEVEEWCIDVCIASTQKCLALPPGLSLCSVSDKAIEAAKEVEFRGYYLDLIRLYDQVKKNFQYPSTPSLSHMYALDYQLDRILEEGLDARFDRHAHLADMVRTWALTHFSLFAEEGYRSNTVTCINNEGKFDFADLSKTLLEKGFRIGSGYGAFKDTTFRIATMGELQEETLAELLAAIDDKLGLEA
ncbi:MAG: alanine--glyoxylate aminotransferase family protein [Clostridiaceae bacterium]|nr:alanine--glyoxylate aminotransferase family protein [Clostridiaceae bacterium]